MKDYGSNEIYVGCVSTVVGVTSRCDVARCERDYGSNEIYARPLSAVIRTPHLIKHKLKHVNFGRTVIFGIKLIGL